MLGHTALPAPSTITDILHRHGLISPQKSLAAEHYQRFERPEPNQLWQIDFKGDFALSRGRCYPLCGLDDHSRYNVLLQACADQQELTVQAHLIGAFRVYGMPEALLWDNGPPWGSAGGSQLTSLDVWLLRLGVLSLHGRPYHPQTQGKQERFHRSLQAEVLADAGRWKDCHHVQQALNRWRPIYNHERPHHALALSVPAQRYKPSARVYPERLAAIEYPAQLQARQVDQDGFISYRNQSWRVGRAFKGLPVALRPTSSDGIFDVLFLSHLIKQIDLRTLPTPP
jgi:transposase InsO family protein